MAKIVSRGRQMTRLNDPAEGVTEDLYRVISTFLVKPYVLVLYILVLLLLFGHLDADVEGVLEKLVREHPTNIFFRWALENLFRVMGALVFLPVVLDLPEDRRLWVGGGVALILLLLPQRSIIEYVIYSLVFLVYTNAKSVKTRFLVFVLALIALVYLGIITSAELSKLAESLPRVPTTRPSSASSNPVQVPVLRSPEGVSGDSVRRIITPPPGSPPSSTPSTTPVVRVGG
ncbi:putative virion protein [Hibiscus yellow blotch virus]|uniref:Putative virion protein n=1 Tax=Hibiscus yellow blotch virus TaxID=2809748 RepID=A0A890CSA5_9VIRU|nr:putative virion protein [Hibiscus yellow blotch virus]QRG34870.1 putative virion protein [Hibiscus yellow blotch virus]